MEEKKGRMWFDYDSKWTYTYLFKCLIKTDHPPQAHSKIHFNIASSAVMRDCRLQNQWINVS